MINNNTVYVRAYTEVYCFLEYLPQSDINKLPKKLIELINNMYNENYRIDIDSKKGLLDQNYSKKTKDILAVIKYNYWSTEEEKKQLTTLFCENEKRYQKEASEKYNTSDIFNRIKIETPKKAENKVDMIVYNENIFIKIFNRIKGFFRN